MEEEGKGDLSSISGLSFSSTYAQRRDLLKQKKNESNEMKNSLSVLKTSNVLSSIMGLNKISSKLNSTKLISVDSNEKYATKSESESTKE